ncbi:MAG: nuclear transport factor 2 family protein, partial [Chthoniobacterales bacterium]
WEAFKKKDKKAYGDLLADDFVAVEDDGDGARNKIHAVDEIAASNVHNYSLAFFKVFPVAPDTVFVTYEVTMEFPPKAVNRFKRVLISEVWIRRGGQWRAWHYQETRVK